MNEGLFAFKVLGTSVVALLVGATMIPDSTGGRFDRFRLEKQKPTVKGWWRQTSTTTTDTTTTPTPTTTTEPTPTPTTTNPTYPEESTVPSNFDINSELVPSWGSGAIPISASPDVVGAFRFICNAGQLAYDDPIVYPGQPGKSHLHQFYGNTAANAYSTTYQLRTQGQSTCMSPLNRSAYWMPAMLDGRGNVVRPDYVTIYYKRRPASDPKCDPARDSQAQGICVPLPNGLKYVFGFNMLGTGAPTGAAYFNCDGAGATPGHYPDIVAVAKNCPAGTRLGAIITAPSCWDGKNLDSADHRSHVAYPGYGSWGYLKCPATHPYVIPTFTMGAWYSVDQSLDRSGTWEAGKTVTWHLSSDAMPGMPLARPGTTFHADWWGAWDNNVMAMWMDNCINKLLNCSGGDLGNGKQLKQFSGFSWTANPRLVPVP